MILPTVAYLAVEGGHSEVEKGVEDHALEEGKATKESRQS